MARQFVHFVVHGVQVPARRDLLAAPAAKGGYTHGSSWDQQIIYLVEGHTSDGLVALGEAARMENAQIVEATLRWLLQQPIDQIHPDHCWSSYHMPDGLPLPYPVRSNHRARSLGLSYSLLQTLWIDATAKAASIPACQLLGGAVRERVLMNAWANRPSQEQLLQLILEFHQRGFSGLKLKCAPNGDTFHSLAAIADQVPTGFAITIDPMLCLDHPSSIASALGRLADAGVVLIVEDPFPYARVDAWHKLAQWPHLRVVCHARTVEALKYAIQHRLAADFNIAGDNVFEIQQMDSLVESQGGFSWCGTSLELGVMQHLRLHSAASCRTALLPSDLSSELVREHTLVTTPMQYEDSHAILPLDRPGLGVTLDPDAVSTYRKEQFEVR